MAAPRTHRYTATVAWRGSTAEGYDRYSRAHDGATPPARHGATGTGTGATALPLSSDPAFGGDPARTNPEQLVVLAASSCQLLSFLAVAARARVDVVAYEDAAEGFMPEDDPPLRIVRIVLKPRVTVRGDAPDDERLRRLTDTAHRHCFVANSLSTEIVVDPTFVRVAPPPSYDLRAQQATSTDLRSRTDER